MSIIYNEIITFENMTKKWHTSNYESKFCVFPNDILLFSQSFMFGKWLHSLPCYEMVKHIWVPDFCSKKMIKIMTQERIWKPKTTPWRLASWSHSLLKVREPTWPFWHSHRNRKSTKVPLACLSVVLGDCSFHTVLSFQAAWSALTSYWGEATLEMLNTQYVWLTH